MTIVESILQKAPVNPVLKFIALVYGIIAYAAFIVTITYAAGFIGRYFVPKDIDSGVGTSSSAALIVNLALMSVFAIQHSVMARGRFKRWWTQYVPKPVERSTYVLFSSLCLMLLFWQWRPMPSIIWQVQDPDAAVALATIPLAGWAIVFASSFMINHFELFGLHQVLLNVSGREAQPPQFRTPWFYKLVRHPLYLGFILAFWSTPQMTVGHLLFAGVTTAYIFVGIFLEERDLIELFGDEYRQYKKRVSAVIPLRKTT